MRIESHSGDFYDVNYYNEKFYTINFSGSIWVWDVSGPNLEVANNILRIDCKLLGHLVESSGGELLVISRGYQLNDDDRDYRVSNFKIVQLDVMKREWKRIISLGDDAIFIGFNAGFSMTSSISPNMVKPNCIYFSDDCIGIGGGKDMGVYHVEDEKIERFNVKSLSLICPPLWIAPTLLEILP